MKGQIGKKYGGLASIYFVTSSYKKSGKSEQNKKGPKLVNIHVGWLYALGSLNGLLRHDVLTSGLKKALTPFPTPSKVTPRKNKTIRMTYGNVAVKYTTCYVNQKKTLSCPSSKY